MEKDLKETMRTLSYQTESITKDKKIRKRKLIDLKNEILLQ